MDQAKFTVPRDRHSQALKSTMMVVKPRFKLHGVWIHGVLLRMWILDPRCPSDSSTIIECGARSIELAASECERRGVALPDQILVWVSCP